PSSGGARSSVAANLVTCSIGEETGGSIHHPAKNNNLVGLAPGVPLLAVNASGCRHWQIARWPRSVRGRQYGGPIYVVERVNRLLAGECRLSWFRQPGFPRRPLGRGSGPVLAGV